jgi:hypothetical protein
MSIKRKTWRCFFCDSVFRSRRSAWYHFGDSNCETDPPACVDPLRKDEAARMKELRDLREHAMEMQRDSEEAENDAGMLQQYRGEIGRLFGRNDTIPPSTPYQAWLKLEAAQNEAEAWRLRAQAYESAIKSAGLAVPRMEWESMTEGIQ